MRPLKERFAIILEDEEKNLIIKAIPFLERIFKNLLLKLILYNF